MQEYPTVEATPGVTTDRERYFDDSSKALGLDRRAKAPSPEIFDRGGDRLPKPGRLRDREIAEREIILAGERAVRDAEIAKLIAQGCTAKQAAEIFERERARDAAAKERKAEERADRRHRAIERLAGMRDKPPGHSSSGSGRKRTAKKGTWVCVECHLEFCEHRPVRSKGGRPATLDRSQRASARVAPQTKVALTSIGLSMSDSLEVLAVMVSTNCSLDDALTTFRSRKGMAATPAA